MTIEISHAYDIGLRLGAEIKETDVSCVTGCVARDSLRHQWRAILQGSEVHTLALMAKHRDAYSGLGLRLMGSVIGIRIAYSQKRDVGEHQSCGQLGGSGRLVRAS